MSTKHECPNCHKEIPVPYICVQCGKILCERCAFKEEMYRIKEMEPLKSGVTHPTKQFYFCHECGEELYQKVMNSQ